MTPDWLRLFKMQGEAFKIAQGIRPPMLAEEIAERFQPLVDREGKDTIYPADVVRQELAKHGRKK